MTLPPTTIVRAPLPMEEGNHENMPPLEKKKKKHNKSLVPSTTCCISYSSLNEILTSEAEGCGRRPLLSPRNRLLSRLFRHRTALPAPACVFVPPFVEPKEEEKTPNAVLRNAKCLLLFAVAAAAAAVPSVKV